MENKTNSACETCGLFNADGLKKIGVNVGFPIFVKYNWFL